MIRSLIAIPSPNITTSIQGESCIQDYSIERLITCHPNPKSGFNAWRSFHRLPKDDDDDVPVALASSERVYPQPTREYFSAFVDGIGGCTRRVCGRHDMSLDME